MSKMALSLHGDDRERCCSAVTAAWPETLAAPGELWSQYGKRSIPLQLCYVCCWAGTLRPWESWKMVTCWCPTPLPLPSCVAAAEALCDGPGLLVPSACGAGTPAALLGACSERVWEQPQLAWASSSIQGPVPVAHIGFP